MRLGLLLTLGTCAFALTSPASASLVGEQVTGTIRFGANPTNYYDPANGFVPAGYGNSGGQPVTIGAGIEFGFSDGANTDTADFSATQLIIRDQVFTNAVNWTQTFTLVGPNQFSSINLVSDSFVPGLTYSINAGTIEINWAGTGAPNDFRAIFDVAANGAVPEPATWAMLILGFGLLGGVMRSAKQTKLAYGL
jgi:hypothetical protein